MNDCANKSLIVRSFIEKVGGARVKMRDSASNRDYSDGIINIDTN